MRVAVGAGPWGCSGVGVHARYSQRRQVVTLCAAVITWHLCLRLRIVGLRKKGEAAGPCRPLYARACLVGIK